MEVWLEQKVATMYATVIETLRIMERTRGLPKIQKGNTYKDEVQ